MMDVLSTEYRTPDGGVHLDWDSYAEFWLSLPNVHADVQRKIEDALPTLEELVGLAAEKNFSESLKEAGVATLTAKRIARFIQKTVYKH